MSVSRKYTVITSVSLSLTLLISGCLENKASQCQRLIQAVNEGNALIDKNKGQQVTTSLQLSKDLEAVTKSIEQLNLQDPKLKEYQSRFAKVFKNLSQGIAKAGKALGLAKTAEASPSGRQKLQLARAEIDTALTAVGKTAGKDSDKLVSDLNKYCSQPE
jgi:small-conductance mechanosensitive channel